MRPSFRVSFLAKVTKFANSACFDLLLSYLTPWGSYARIQVTYFVGGVVDFCCLVRSDQFWQ